MVEKLLGSKGVKPAGGASEYRPASGVSRASLDGEGRAMLLDGRRGGHYYMLDELGTRIWDRLVNGATLEAIVDDVALSYDAPREAVEADARAFLQRMLLAKLVVAT